MLEFLLEINFVKPLSSIKKDKIDIATEISTVMSVFTHTFCPIATIKDKIDITTEISTVMSVFTHTFCPIATIKD